MIGRNDPCWCGSGKKYKKCHMHSDMESRSRPLSKHSNSMIKSPEEIIKMRKACKFNGELMDYIRPYIKAGISTEKINTIIHDYTIKHGHTPATLGYKGFPKSVCISTNDIVCHGIPSPETILKDGDIVNIDLTTIVDSYHGDSSETFIIGEISDEARHLVKVAAKSLLIGIEAAGPGKHLKAIGQAIEPYVKSQNCSVVRKYTGHGVGKNFHEFFSVFHHISSDCDNITLQPGITLTIEPMINLGSREVVIDKKDGWTVRTKDGSLSAQFEHTLLITDSGAEVLTRTLSQIASGTLLNLSV